MTIDFQKLVKEYWGDRSPPSWKSLDEIAQENDTTVNDLESLMVEYSVERRLKPLEAHRVVWNILSNEWNLVFNEDFLYKHKVGMVFALFYFPKYDIGINLDPNILMNESKSIFVGDREIVSFGTSDFDLLRLGVVNFLDKYRVLKVFVPEEKNNGGW